MPATPERAPAATGNVLGFDFGQRLIGVAVGNRLAGRARALESVANGDWPRVDLLVREWSPDRFVVGLPLALDGSEPAIARAARAFAAALEHRFGRPAELVDERYSSREAAGRFAERRAHGAARRRDAAAIDALAAEVILDAWFAQARPA
jgi:putative Holliday junction resolvase